MKDLEPQKRTIRNVPLPPRRRKTDFVDSVAPATVFKETPPTHPLRRSDDIVPPEIKRRRATDAPPRVEDRRVPPVAPPTTPRRPAARSRFFRKTPILAGLAGVLVLGFIVFNLFSGATLTYAAKSADITLNKDIYTATKEAGEDGLPFSVIKLSGEKGVNVKANGEEQVSEKASGRIIVYNNGSSNSERLIKNTRFETPDGKIYRIQEDITIPGKTASGAGSIEVTVYADKAGAEYNTGLTDFTVPGLKGDPRYSTIYARSKTPMTGGLVGLAKRVSQGDMENAKNNLEASLKEDLVNQAIAQVPGDFILYPNLVSITFSDLPQTNAENGEVTINRSAEFSGVIFKKSDLNEFLGQRKLEGAIPAPVELSDLSSLQAAFAGESNVNLLEASSIQVELSGNLKAESVVDENSLKSKLRGSAKSSLDDILREFPSIENASLVVRPFWKSAVPDETEKIKIVKSS